MWKLSSLPSAPGIWPVNRLKVDHNLFNPFKIYTEAAENIDFTKTQPEVSNEHSGVDTSICASGASVGAEASISVCATSVTEMANQNLPRLPVKDTTVISASVPSSSTKHNEPIEAVTSFLNSIPGGSKSVLDKSP